MTIAANSTSLRIDWPAGTDATLAMPLPVAGGVPFKKGALASAENIRLLDSNGKEIPCQATRLAVWPDGSVKWALIDAILAPTSSNLRVEYGPDVRRAAVADPLTAALNGADAQVSGGGVKATIRKNGGGVFDELTIGKNVISGARLVLETVRASGPEFLPTNTFLCRDPNAVVDTGKVQIDELTVESPGPIRATVLLRGVILLPHFGATLPDEIKRVEPAGKMPFSMRLSFYKDCGAVFGQHQIVFSGEPDCDYISHWGIELPKAAGARGCLIVEPGAELSQVGETFSASKETRLCWAPLQNGLALIRHGWQNRPCAITQENSTGSQRQTEAARATLEFWPRAAGLWDLRRYAREWSVGESGDTKDVASIQRFAKYAARGMAKSHDFVLWLGEVAPASVPARTPAPPPAGRDAGTTLATALSDRALLLAPPAVYANSNALGTFSPQQVTGEFATLDADTSRRIDYHLYCQDLFGWYGKTVYGFWQSRYGQVHRNDRWDNDYGRWGWALNDGAGRIGHLLMLEFLRSGARRYFEAGEAFNRINYDTSMVHTAQHLEGTKNWWSVKGCTHRHDAQPFGCPYIGMRGSYPVGHRILYMLTGDGVIADGLEIVSDAALRSHLGNSGDSDGQGSATNALLWKYETTGDKKYLDACRAMLEKSNLFPPKSAKDLGYGPSFGIFNAAGEYAELADDKAFQERLVAVARMGAKEKEPDPFLYAIAMGYRFSKDEALKTQLESMLKKRIASPKESLELLPPEQWPGHAGWRTPSMDPNTLRDIPYAMAALKPAGTEAGATFAAPRPALRGSNPPKDWFKPVGAQTAQEKVPAAAELLKLTPAAVPAAAANAISVQPFVELAAMKGDAPLAKPELLKPEALQIDPAAKGGAAARVKAGTAEFAVRWQNAQADGVPSVRLEAACQLPKGAGRIASWGLLVPLKLSANGNLIQTTAPGRFRLERCRLDQNDERIPNWLTSEYHWGEGASLWPKWRLSGIQIGPGDYYSIWRSTREDTSPLICDAGPGGGNWLDLTDRGASPRWGLTARVLRVAPASVPAGRDAGATQQSIRVNLETGVMRVEFHDSAAAPLGEASSALAGAVDLIFHDGWRPPLAKPELTAAQYEKFMADLNYGGNHGLFALRFALSITHQVQGKEWAEKLRDLGLEPRELLYSMLWADALAKHCQKLGVKYDPADIEASVRRVIEHYR
ncbi:MAG TPA: hypothetical protein VGP72_21490 [Planctomycetota bacterium]